MTIALIWLLVKMNAPWWIWFLTGIGIAIKLVILYFGLTE